MTYGYDAENRRISVTDGSGTTTFVINPNASPDQVLVKTAPGGTKTFYVYGLGLLHEETGGTPRYYHFDRRGDTIALTDYSGAVTGRAAYGVYGELLSQSGTLNTPFLFNGRWGVQTDANGLYYHRARYYHLTLRRFLNQDTVLGSIADSASMNRFAYANGNPVSLIDPFGLTSQDAEPTIWDRFRQDILDPIFSLLRGILDPGDRMPTGRMPRYDETPFDDYRRAGDVHDPSSFEHALTMGLVIAPWLRYSPSRVPAIAAESGESSVLFGQRRIGPAFSTGEGVPSYLSGRLVSAVAADLRSGVLGADQLPINAFRGAKGELITINNRTLGALSEAGLQPTRISLVSPTRNELLRLTERPIINSPIPGPKVPVTPSASDPIVLRIIRIP